MIKAIAQERSPDRSGEQISDVPVPQVMQSVDVFNSLGDARCVRAPRFQEDIDDVMKVTLPEGMSDRIREGHVPQRLP